MRNRVRRRKIKYFYKIASQIYSLNDFNRKLNSNKFPQFTYNSPKYEIDKLKYRLIGDNKFYEIFKN